MKNLQLISNPLSRNELKKIKGGGGSLAAANCTGARVGCVIPSECSSQCFQAGAQKCMAVRCMAGYVCCAVA